MGGEVRGGEGERECGKRVGGWRERMEILTACATACTTATHTFHRMAGLTGSES